MHKLLKVASAVAVFGVVLPAFAAQQWIRLSIHQEPTKTGEIIVAKNATQGPWVYKGNPIVERLITSGDRFCKAGTPKVAGTNKCNFKYTEKKSISWAIATGAKV